MSFINNFYYTIRPVVPKRLLVLIRQIVIRYKRRRYDDIWPVCTTAGSPPSGWSHWPENKKFALVLTHDIETQEGCDKCWPLMEFEESLGFRSAFYAVPERYRVPDELVHHIQQQGFEIGVHGLKHDGKLFKNKTIFSARAVRINHYIQKWNAVGFRSPAMLHNLDWIHELHIQYDSSSADIDPFEPQPLKLETLWPCVMRDHKHHRSYVELPYTLAQDFSTFVLMQEKTIDAWKQKLDWIVKKGGMALLLTHPDYMHFGSGKPGYLEYPATFYQDILKYIKEKYEGQYWHVLPHEMAVYWRTIEKSDNVNQQKLDSTTVTKPSYSLSSGSVSPTVSAHAKRKPLRICMVAYTFYELDNRVKRYAEALAQRGDHVDVIAIGQGESSFYEEIKGVHVYRVQKRLINEKTKLSYLNRLVMFLLRSGILLTRRHFKKPYNLIHVHSVPDFEVFAALIPKCFKAKIILDIHDIVPEFYSSKFNVSKDSFLYKGLKWVEKISIAFSNHVIVANHLWQKVLVSRSVRENKCDVYLNYPDSAIFSPRERSRQDDKFVVLYPGTLNWHQGLDVAVRALSIIKDQASNMQLHIYGDGPERPKLEILAKDLDLDDRVMIHKFVPMEQVADLMAGADLGVVPKRKDSFGNEAFSTKIFEFMSLDIPVIAANTKIDTFYFNDSVVQFFESGDEKDLAQKMLMLYHDSQRRKQLAQNASKFVRKNSWDFHKERYYDLVDKLCCL